MTVRNVATLPPVPRKFRGVSGLEVNGYNQFAWILSSKLVYVLQTTYTFKRFQLICSAKPVPTLTLRHLGYSVVT